MLQITDTDDIRIISGEGEVGTIEAYTGKKTERAIKCRLTRERCNGDRWARAEVLIAGHWHDVEGR